MRQETIAAISTLVLAGVLIICSVARADRTIRATSGNDVLYFGVVDDAGVKKLCVVTKTGSGAKSVGIFNMDAGRLTIYGQEGDDHIEAIDNDTKEDIAFDRITNLRFTEVYLYGGRGNDELLGTHLGDNLYGNEGNDLLVGKEGVDILNGDDGDDYLWAYPGDDFLDGGSGDDFLLGDQGNDTLLGGPGNDTLVGGVDDDTIDGESGYDRFWCRQIPAVNPYAHWDDRPGEPASTDCGDSSDPANVELVERNNPYSDWVYLSGYGHGLTAYHRTTSNPRLLMADRAAGAVILMSSGGDIPIAGDFDRDGVCDDLAVFRPTTRSWYYDYDHDGDTDDTFHWAIAGDIPVAGDFDRDGRTDDVAVFRPGNRTWYYDYNHNETTDDTSGPWGNPGDIPIAGDFDRDGRCDDVAVFRPGNRTWYYDYNHNGTTDTSSGPWANPGDIPIAGDFDRDGRCDDVAVFRPGNRRWYYDHEHNGTTDPESGLSYGPWGNPGDIPIAGDFDRDGRCDDVGVFRLSDVKWRYDYNHDGNTDPHPGFTSGPWGFCGEPLHTTHKQYGNSCGPTSLNMVFEHLGMTNHSLRRWFRRDLDHTSGNPVPSPWWPDNAVDVGYELSMEHIMWEGFHEKRQREPGWHYNDNFMTSDGLLNTDNGTMDGSYLEIGYDIGNYLWDPIRAERSGALQKWLQHCPGVGWSDNEQQIGLPYVANKFSGGMNEAKPIALTVGGGGNFKSFSHLNAVIEGFINHGIPLVVAVENGGHFNTLIGYWNIGSTFYIYTAEPLDGWGRPFYNKPMRWRRMLLNSDMLATGTGTLVGMMLYGHAAQAGVGADWAQEIDERYKSNLLCGYLR